MSSHNLVDLRNYVVWHVSEAKLILHGCVLGKSK